MSTIAEASLEPKVNRWVLVAAAVAALFVAALVILGQAESAPTRDEVHALDNGL
jgi:hypothetical protein